MSEKNGNTCDAGRKSVMDFIGRVCQEAWGSFKPAILSGKFDFSKFNTSEKIRAGFKRGFLSPEKNCATDLGLEIGKVTKEQFAKLSTYDKKSLYELFYQQVFGLNISFLDELMPECPNSYWPICIPAIISNEAAYRSGKLEMPKRKFTNKELDSVMKLDRGRDAIMHGSYIVCTPPDFEAGELLKNVSGNDIDKRGDNVLMFRERWILGAFIFWLMGLHLDRNVVTMTGSRDCDGRVLGVVWDGGGVRVVAFHPDVAGDDLGFRLAIS